MLDAEVGVGGGAHQDLGEALLEGSLPVHELVGYEDGAAERGAPGQAQRFRAEGHGGEAMQRGPEQEELERDEEDGQGARPRADKAAPWCYGAADAPPPRRHLL